MDAVTRFWTKVAVRGPDECWLWMAGKDHGYGSFGLWKGKSVRAHRLAWELVKGPIPDGKHVLHHCDNPPCVNPRHLYVGTDADNGRDRAERGRAVNNFAWINANRKPGWNRKVREDDRRGWNTPRKLTDEQADQIRTRHAAGASMRLLAKEHGVTHPTISEVIHKRGVYGS